jgi:hypothetical protein
MSAFQSSSSSSSSIFPTPYESDSELENSRAILPPPILQRVYPKNRTRSEYYILPDPDHEAVFTAWWKETRWHRHHPTINILWYGKNNKTSPVWEYYREIARARDGKPEVQCIRCDYTLVHPSASSLSSGTSALRRHIASKACTKESKKTGHKDVAAFFYQGRVST